MAAPDAPPPVFSGAELLVAALNHSIPLTCTKSTDRWGLTECTWGTAVWESDDLLRMAAVSKELTTAATADHLWQPLLARFMQEHPFGEDGAGVCPHVFPVRIHGTRRDVHSLLPHPRDRVARAHVPALVLDYMSRFVSQNTVGRFNEATGEVEDKFHPASEDPGAESWNNNCPTTIWLPRPPALMRCEACDGLSFECGRAFKEHCSGWKHCQLMLPPEERLPVELWDPRWNRQAFAALTPQCRYSAIHLHVETVMAALNAPVDEAGMANMERHADDIRDFVYRQAAVCSFDEDDERYYEEAAELCVAQAVVDAVREHFLIHDFKENGLTAFSSDAHDFFARRSKGWAGWAPGGSSSWLGLAGCVSGLSC
jgi:hypothetical protein